MVAVTSRLKSLEAREERGQGQSVPRHSLNSKVCCCACHSRWRTVLVRGDAFASGSGQTRVTSERLVVHPMTRLMIFPNVVLEEQKECATDLD